MSKIVAPFCQCVAGEYQEFGHGVHCPEGSHSIHYVHLGTVRRDMFISREAAERQIGQRVMIGFTLWHRYVVSPIGERFIVTAFQSDVTGKVWAVYIDRINP